jgi:hypothetical protein
MSKKILVMGGYGAVGRGISTELGRLFPGAVYAAGRSLARAAAFAETTGGRVLPLAFDAAASDAGAFDSLPADVGMVVMCLDQTDTRFVQACLERGLVYVDISASDDFHKKVEALDPLAREKGGTALLSVGLSPGLTNLLVKYAAARVEGVVSADIAILLGLGERHGRAAIEWTVDQLLADFPDSREGAAGPVRALSDGRSVEFPGLGRRTAYRFNFSDQHALHRTLSIPAVVSRLCFDVEIVGRLLALAKRSGALGILRWRVARRLAIRAFEIGGIGQEVYALRIDVRGSAARDAGGQFRCVLRGHREAESTAQVAARVADLTYRKRPPAGVLHIEQLLDLSSVLPEQWIDATVPGQISVDVPRGAFIFNTGPAGQSDEPVS